MVVRAGATSNVPIKLEESDSAAVKLLKSQRFWGWTSAGLGVAALGASIGLLAHSATLRDDMVELNKTHVSGYADYARQYDDLDSERSTMLTSGYAMLGVGIALAATGTTLLVLDYMGEEESSADAGPTWQISPSLTGFDAMVRF